MRLWAEWPVALALCVAQAAGAVEPAPPASEETELLELLEFLGSFETDDGEWVSPFTFLGEPAAADDAQEPDDG